VSTEEYPIEGFGGAHTEALVRNVISSFENYAKLSKKIPSEVLVQVSSLNDPAKLSDTVVAHLPIRLTDKQEILELPTVKDQMEKLLPLLEGEIEILEIEKKIRGRVKKQMERTQKEFYLNEQMRAIQKELGQGDDGRTELDELEEKIKKKKMGKEAQQKAEKEIKKLRLMSPMSAEATVSRNYIDWLISLPWQERTEDKLDIEAAEKVLNEDHYGLEKVKERILEYLAVRKLVTKLKGPMGDGTKIRPHVLGRRSRRGGDPGTPEDIHRGPPGEDHAADEEGGFGQPRVSAGRGRQDVDGLPGGPFRGAPRGPRPRAEQYVQRPLPGRRL
jgi:ATP-dependent Lon protease